MAFKLNNFSGLLKNATTLRVFFNSAVSAIIFLPRTWSMARYQMAVAEAIQ